MKASLVSGYPWAAIASHLLHALFALCPWLSVGPLAMQMEKFWQRCVGSAYHNDFSHMAGICSCTPNPSMAFVPWSIGNTGVYAESSLA